VHRRLAVYKADWSHGFFDVFAPALAIVIGICLTSITIYTPSPSRILHPSRTSADKQLIVVDAKLSGPDRNDEIVNDLMALFPDREEYFDVHMHEHEDVSKLPFDDFGDFIFAYGKENAPEMPHFYSGYQIYKADTQSH
jgi:hypothetical protein